MGASGPIILPDLTDGAGNVKHLAVGVGKDGNIYVVDRDSMGKFNSSRNNIWQELDGAVSQLMRATGAYFNGRVYVADVAPLKAYSVVDAKLSASPTSVSSVSFGYPGGSPVISANGNNDGIVWAIDSLAPGRPHRNAFDVGRTLDEKLYNSNQAANGRDHFGAGSQVRDLYS